MGSCGLNVMDVVEKEFTALLKWLGTLTLKSEAGSISNGLTMAEALAQMEPSIFTPSWFAGLQNSCISCKIILKSVLDGLQLFYGRKFRIEAILKDFSLPIIPDECHCLSKQMCVRFLKLILGVSLTCSNRDIFIHKIKSLDETTQGILYTCASSFLDANIYINQIEQKMVVTKEKDNDFLAKKCHDLDYKVNKLQDEHRLMATKNKELHSSLRKKEKQFERNMLSIKEEIEKWKQDHDEKKSDSATQEGKLKQRVEGETSAHVLLEQTVSLRKEFEGRSLILANTFEKQQNTIKDLRSRLESQTSDQSNLRLEFQELKDRMKVFNQQEINQKGFWKEILSSKKFKLSARREKYQALRKGNLLDESLEFSGGNIIMSNRKLFEAFLDHLSNLNMEKCSDFGPIVKTFFEQRQTLFLDELPENSGSGKLKAIIE